MQIVIRVDTSAQIGTGHFMRCLTLANQAAKEGHTVNFLTRTPNQFFVNKIKSYGHKMLVLQNPDTVKHKYNYVLDHSHWLDVSQECDAHESKAVVKKLRPDWIIIDHYAIDQRWHKIVQPICKNIMVVDDLADRRLDCKILLDQNLGSSKKNYEGWAPADCKFLIGPKYALLREEFMDWRQFSLDRRPTKQVKKILVTMGGVDTANYTLMVLSELVKSKFSQKLHFDVVVGSAYPHRIQLVEFCHQSKIRIVIKVDVENIAEIMAKSDLCIGAAGSTSWERCCLGLPTITMAIAKNQLKIIRVLQDREVAVVSSPNRIREDFDKFFDVGGVERLLSLSNNSKEVFDVLGAQRVVRTMEDIYANSNN